MSASGTVYFFEYGGKGYYFDGVKMSFANKIESTALADGGCIRVRTCGSPETMTLHCRIEVGEIFDYETLLRSMAAADSISFSINKVSYGGYALLAGRITGAEKRDYCECEFTLTEVTD